MKLISAISLGLVAFLSSGALAADPLERRDNGAQPAAVAERDLLLARTAPVCTRDQCLRAFLFKPVLAKLFCKVFTALPPPPYPLPTPPSFHGPCGLNPSRISSACSCAVTSPPTTTTTTTTTTTSTSTSSIASPTCIPVGEACDLSQVPDNCCDSDFAGGGCVRNFLDPTTGTCQTA
ncbi:hypothetical protein QBC37DRAFT_371807 [Rhypophila decipiens]|uniref:Uncharacterized protein n=1 Tax=Rhypophila decipiens TaxID=261697 RepID=A0AAN7BA00_9PEZI|nr:hypothetical protein QBC37DRAFT_371807 [Rhypophila decipiens]